MSVSDVSNCYQVVGRIKLLQPTKIIATDKSGMPFLAVTCNTIHYAMGHAIQYRAFNSVCHCSPSKVQKCTGDHVTVEHRQDVLIERPSRLFHIQHPKSKEIVVIILHYSIISVEMTYTPLSAVYQKLCSSIVCPLVSSHGS